MSANVTLREILNQFRKSDLVEIAKIHHLRGWSQYNKVKMVEFLQEKLLDAEVMRQYFMFLSEAELELLDSQDNEIWIEPGDDRYDYLIEGAYVGLSCEWSGNLLCVPSDVKTAYLKNCGEKWKQDLEDDRRFLMYLNVLVELYGICSIEQVVELYVRDGGRKRELFEVLAFCEKIPENTKFFVMKGEQLLLKLWSEGDMYKELQRKQKGCSFYEPTKEEIEHLGTKGYLPFNDEMLQLQEFFMKEGHEEEQDAELLCKTIQMIIRTGGTYEHIRDVLEVGFMDFEYVIENEKLQRKLTRRLDGVWRHTNMVTRRGHMIADTVAEKPKSNIITFPGNR